MFQPHFTDEVVATAIIEGLAVAKYNQGEAKWETTILRNCGHYPKLIIRKVDRRSGRVDSIIKEYIIAAGDSISITVKNPTPGIDWKYVEGDFNRQNPAQRPQDLRWMLDIDELYDQNPGRLNPPKVETNLLTTSNGCFYTSVRTKRPYRMRFIKTPPPTPMPDPRPIGITGKTFGVDFLGDTVTVEVSGVNGFSKTFDKSDPSFRYELIFDNTCVGEYQPPQGETDFRFYYKIFDDSNGRVEVFPPESSGTMSMDGGTGADSPAEDTDQDPKEPACQSLLEGDGIINP